ncbi:MAG: hypothetical protein IPO64_08990 [Bacteroidetes bacterium]|nr:hypothetical protein [Bacteroidota bacterium]
MMKINNNETHLFTAMLLENNSKFNLQIQHDLMQTYLNWITENPTLNLYINNRSFVKYTKKANPELSFSLINLFLETLLSKELFIKYQLRNQELEPMEWYQPESALYKLGDDINLLSNEISMRTNLFIITTENIEKYDEFYNQLEYLKRKLNDCLYCLQLFRYSKNTANNEFDDTAINKIKNRLPLEIQEKLNHKHLLVLMRLQKTESDLEEIMNLFKEEAGIEISELDFIKITEALLSLKIQEENVTK